jgi:hypothetical protein
MPDEQHRGAVKQINDMFEEWKNGRLVKGGLRSGISNPRNYKAVIFFMLAGGCDSFNMIVPQKCSNNIVQQYEKERGEPQAFQCGKTQCN